MESVSGEGSSLGPRASYTFTVTVEPGPAPARQIQPVPHRLPSMWGWPPSRPCRLHPLPFSPANVSLLLHHTPAGAGLGSAC